MSLEDLKFINILADGNFYATPFELLTAALIADENAAQLLLSDLQ